MTGERVRFREMNQTKKCGRERGGERGQRTRRKRNEEKQVGRRNEEGERQVSSGFCSTEGNIRRGGNS